MQGKYTEALGYYEQAAALEPQPALHLPDHGAQLSGAGGLRPSDRHVPPWTDRRADDPWLRFELGKTLRLTGDEELGLRAAQSGGRPKPDMPEAYKELAIGLYLRRSYEEAIENMTKAIDLGNEVGINFYIIGLL